MYKVKKLYLRAILAASVASCIFPTYTEKMEVSAIESSSDTHSYQTVDGSVSFGRGTASVTIEGNSGQSLVGKKFNVYKLFTAENSKNEESINYTFTPEYAEALKNVVAQALSEKNNTTVEASSVTEYMVIDFMQGLNTNQVEGAKADQTNEGVYSSFRYFVEDVRTELEKLNVTADSVDVVDTTPENTVNIEGLEYGYYIIDEITSVQGTHAASSLCMVDTLNASAEIKIKSDYPILTKKIQEDDKSASITDTDGWNDIADYEIGQTVHYKSESIIPNINGYGTYYYAWHDNMDDALTFHPDSVIISITGTTSDGEDKTYSLTSSEYRVLTDDLENETFSVTCNDIKSIIDREFDQINENGENVYGQKVCIKYTATLNDKAAEYTGRPGFENDIRLEFSNDPDADGNGSTGFTPWDTVVCFTYKLEILKTNEHQNILADATFRLYSDKDCKNEVYVKQIENKNEYIVINRDILGGTDHNGGQVPDNAVEIVSGSDGKLMIYGLDGGRYYLKETKAPDGYRLLKDAIVIDVLPQFTDSRDGYIKGNGATANTLKELSATAQIDSFFNGMISSEQKELEADTGSGTIYLNVVNRVGSKLPVTGTSAVSLMFIGGIILMGSSIILSKKKERKES